MQRSRVLGHREQKDQTHRRAVRRIPGDAFGQRHGGNRRPDDRFTFGVGHSHRAAHGGGAAGFPVKNILQAGFGVPQNLAVCRKGFHQGADHSGFVGRRSPDQNPLGGYHS